MSIDRLVDDHGEDADQAGGERAVVEIERLLRYEDNIGEFIELFFVGHCHMSPLLMRLIVDRLTLYLRASTGPDCVDPLINSTFSFVSLHLGLASPARDRRRPRAS